MKIEEVVIKFEETVIKTSQRMTAIEAHFPDLKFSVMKIEVFSEGLYRFHYGAEIPTSGFRAFFAPDAAFCLTIYSLP